MKTILSSLKESFRSIKKEKGMFLLLFFTQLAFILLISSLFYNYASSIGKDLEVMREPIEGISGEIDPLDTMALFEQTAGMQEAYDNIKTRVMMFMVFAFLSYVVINGLNWNIANRIVDEKSSFLKYWIMFGLSTLYFTIFLLLLAGIFINALAFLGFGQFISFIGSLFYIIVTYFAYISFGLLNNYDANDVVKFLGKTFSLGSRKMGLLLSYILILLLLVLSVLLVNYLLFANMILLMISVVLVILVMAWSKVYFLTAVKNA